MFLGVSGLLCFLVVHCLLVGLFLLAVLFGCLLVMCLLFLCFIIGVPLCSYFFHPAPTLTTCTGLGPYADHVMFIKTYDHKD